MRLIAHRGFAAVHPENTVRAVRAAARVADAVEVDVRRCATGELVVIHDATVDRVTDGTGPVADHSLAELRALDVLGTGEGVPTLSSVLEAVTDGVGVNVELKEAGTAAAALAVVTDSGTDAWISSFAPDVLAAARTADPSVPLAFLTADGGPAAVRAAVQRDCTALHPAAGVCDARLVDRAHAAGLTVNAWTVDRRTTARSLADCGVDGVIADRPTVRPDDRG
jgi:glycerophosphoryl diester phosphodiesterase